MYLVWSLVLSVPILVDYECLGTIFIDRHSQLSSITMPPIAAPPIEGHCRLGTGLERVNRMRHAILFGAENLPKRHEPSIAALKASGLPPTRATPSRKPAQVLEPSAGANRQETFPNLDPLG